MEKDKQKSDWKKYQNIGLAAYFNKSKSEKSKDLIFGAITQFAEDRKDIVGNTGEYKLLIHSLKTGGLEGVLQSYLPDYINEKDNTTIEQLTTDYDKIISEYLDEQNSEIVKEIFGRFGSYKLKDIKSRLKELSYKLTGHKEGYNPIFNEDELKKLEKEAIQYQTIIKNLEEYEETYFDELTPAAVKQTNKQKHEKSALELMQMFYQ